MYMFSLKSLSIAAKAEVLFRWLPDLVPRLRGLSPLPGASAQTDRPY
jgi:hypothetical protein